MTLKAAILVHIIVVGLIGAIFLYNYSSSGNQSLPLNDDLQKPIWKSTDLELHKVLNIYTPHNVITYNVESESKPAFYTGAMPLKYNLGYYVQRSMDSPLFYNFSDYITYFVNYGPVIVGAQTQDKNDHIVAEVANVTLDVKGNEQIITITEYHYNINGQAIFKSVSQIDPYSNYKIKEIDKAGTKVKEYYSYFQR